MQELAVEVRAERGAANSDDEDGGARGKKVLDLLALLVQKYLLYWYKSTIKATSGDEDGGARGKEVLNLLALLVQKYKY